MMIIEFDRILLINPLLRSTYISLKIFSESLLFTMVNSPCIDWAKNPMNQSYLQLNMNTFICVQKN